MGNLFNIKIKPYDWMLPNEFALVKPGKLVRVSNKQTGKEYAYIAKLPEIVKTRVAPPTAKAKEG